MPTSLKEVQKRSADMDCNNCDTAKGLDCDPSKPTKTPEQTMKNQKRLTESGLQQAILSLARSGESDEAEALMTVVTADEAPEPGDQALQNVVDKIPLQQRALSALKEHLDDSEKLYKTLGQIIKAERAFLESKAHEMSSGMSDKTFFDFSESGWAFGGAAMFAQHLSNVLKGLDQGKLAESVSKAFGPIRPAPVGIETASANLAPAAAVVHFTTDDPESPKAKALCGATTGKMIDGADPELPGVTCPKCKKLAKDYLDDMEKIQTGSAGPRNAADEFRKILKKRLNDMGYVGDGPDGIGMWRHKK